MAPHSGAIADSWLIWFYLHQIFMNQFYRSLLLIYWQTFYWLL